MTIPELTLAGPPRERGRVHGETLRETIADGVGRWKEAVSGQVDPDRVIDEVATKTGFLATAEAHASELVEEVRGIAEGAGQSFETMLAWQLIDEVWWYVDEMIGAIDARERCTAFAISDGARGWVGQTQDLPRHLDGGQVLLRYQDEDGLEVLAPSIAGLLALNGTNSSGFAACITTLSQLPHSTDGLSSGFIVPTLMRCRSVDEGLAFLRSTPIASGNSYVFGTAGEVCGVEVSSEAVEPFGADGRFLHTNHALVLEPVHEYVRFAGSVERLAQIDEAVAADSDLDDLLAVYGQAPICRPRAAEDHAMSVGTMFFELGPEPACHFAPGPLDSDLLVTYRFTEGE